MLRRHASVLALFFLAPLVAEYLQGELPIILLPLIVALAPMYGGGSLLIREVTRRTGRGWPTIVTLAVAFGVLEEGLLTQSLFNANYLGQHLLKAGYIHALGIGAPWTIFVVGIHVIGSITAPIAIVEESTGPRRTIPWLTTTGMVVTTILFLIGCAVTFAISYSMTDGGGHYLAPAPKLTIAAAIVLVLVAVAFVMPRPKPVRPAEQPSPGLAYALICVLGAGFMSVTFLPVPVGVTVSLVSLAAAAALGAWCGNTPWRRYAFAVAALTTYAWHSFTEGNDAKGAELILNIASHVIFTGVAAYIALVAYRRIKGHLEGAPAPEPIAHNVAR